MGHQSIFYQTRSADDGRKLSGGTFGFTENGQYFDRRTIDRLVSNNFTVEISNSGRPFFVDRSGERVWLYIGVDPMFTELGKDAYDCWRAEKLVREEAAEKQRMADEAEIEELIDELGHEEAVCRLRGDRRGDEDG